MDEQDKKTPPKQLCAIRIMFPVDTDELAIAYKKKISDVLADIPNVRVEFTLTSRPPLMPDGS